MGVGKDYEVLVSKRVRTEQNYLGHILTLIDRPIFKPAKQIYWPDKNNLEWHRKKKFGIGASGVRLRQIKKLTEWTFYLGRIAIVVSQLSQQRS